MQRVLGRLLFIIAAYVPLVAPLSTQAVGMSQTQVITITARVAPARSIVINDAGDITMIYSNTDQQVTPKVYLNQIPGKQRVLTPQLRGQYDQIMAAQTNVVGVAIPVKIVNAHGASVPQLISSLLRSAPLIIGKI